MTTINLLGTARRACNGITRRETLTLGALSLLGGFLNQSNLLALEQIRTTRLLPAKAKSVVLIYLQGGPPTQDMFDLKPDAPIGIRSEFQPIASSTPGISVCELLPKTSHWMHKTTVVRSVYHNGGCHKNMPMYTGFDINLPDEEFRETDPPSMGSVCAYLEGGTVYGASDRQAAFIKDNPVHIRDIVATIYRCLGIDPAMAVHDQAGRPIPIAHGGEPIADILA